MEEPSKLQISFDDSEIERLRKLNFDKQASLEKKREIEQLKMEGQRIEMQDREISKRYGTKFNFNIEKAKFWSLAVVGSIAGAVILIKIFQKLF